MTASEKIFLEAGVEPVGSASRFDGTLWNRQFASAVRAFVPSLGETAGISRCDRKDSSFLISTETARAVLKVPRNRFLGRAINVDSRIVMHVIKKHYLQ
jgi:hypothetical protein